MEKLLNPSSHAAKVATLRPANASETGTPDIAQIERFFGPIYDGALETPPWKTALNLLRDTLQASQVALMLRPPAWESDGAIVNADSRGDQAAESYRAQSFATDPFLRLPAGEIVTPEQLLGDDWLQSALYLDFLQPMNIRYVIGADVRTPEGVECRFRVTRSQQAAAFTEHDRALCRLLLPHFKRAIQLRSRLDPLQRAREFFAGTARSLHMGMINLAADGSVLASNAEAKRVLLERDGLELTRDRLRTDSVEDAHKLEQLVVAAIRGHGGASGPPAIIDAMTVARPSGRGRLGLIARAVETAAQPDEHRQPAAVLFLRDPEASAAQPEHEVVRRLYGFSRMESALAARLAQGLTLGEAARQLNIGADIARGCLRQLFCKTGATRQTTLVQLLLNNPERLR